MRLPVAIIMLTIASLCPSILADTNNPRSLASVEKGPATPRMLMWRFFDATRHGHWEDAAALLQLSEHSRSQGPKLAMELKSVIDHNHWIDLKTLSDDPQGMADDGLPEHLDKVGTIASKHGPQPIKVIRIQGTSSTSWYVSQETVELIPEWFENTSDSSLSDFFFDWRMDFLLLPGPFEFLWWQWCLIPVLTLISYIISRTFGKLLARLLRNLSHHNPYGELHIRSSRIAWPVSFICFILLFLVSSRVLHMTDPARHALIRFASVVTVFAVFWTFWALINEISNSLLNNRSVHSNQSATTIIQVARDFFRTAVVIIGLLSCLSYLGMPVRTLIAGLGIGGLAFAFGAQKVVENLFGSISLAADQPFRVGDFVCVDGFYGTVEKIGLRSTRFRTLDRTLIAIPNGKLSELKCESFGERDRFRLAMTLSLTYSTKPEQIVQIVADIEEFLRNQSFVWQKEFVVSLQELAAYSINIEIMVWLETRVIQEFRTYRQILLLGFMKIVQAAGTSLAFPTQTLHLDRNR